MSTVEFKEGDEIVVVRRRRYTVKNAESGEEEERTENTDISIVGVPTTCRIGGPGGEIRPDYEANPDNPGRDRRFLLIKLPMRY